MVPYICIFNLLYNYHVAMSKMYPWILLPVLGDTDMISYTKNPIFTMYTAQNNSSYKSLMSHEIEKTYIIIILTSRFVSTVCLLMLNVAPMQGYIGK